MCSSMKSHCMCTGEKNHIQDFRGWLTKALQYGVHIPLCLLDVLNRCILWSWFAFSMVISQRYLIVVLLLTSAYGSCSIIPSCSGARSQFSVLKFFKLLAVNFPPPPAGLLQLLLLLNCAKEGNVDFYYGRKFLVFQKACLKCCHSHYYWTTLDSVLFSVWCRQKDLKKGSCADAIKWTLSLLAQAILLGLNVLVPS